MRKVLIGFFMVLVIGVAARIMMLPRLSGAPSTVPATGRDKIRTDLRTLLSDQVEAWNRGDIESFMKGYWHSPQTVFAGSTGVQRGWDALLDRYRRNYPDRSAMGRLSFSELEITSLSDDSAVILGRWQLQREKDSPGGIFTLVTRRLPEGWRIVHDHTSVAASAAPH